jgi:hypothetical protein
MLRWGKIRKASKKSFLVSLKPRETKGRSTRRTRHHSSLPLTFPFPRIHRQVASGDPIKKKKAVSVTDSAQEIPLVCVGVRMDLSVISARSHAFLDTNDIGKDTIDVETGIDHQIVSRIQASPRILLHC